MYKIEFYVPASHVEPVKQALFDAGAGRVGEYQHCAWQVLGEGQFCPLEGSDPYIGQKNKLQKVQEYKVEMVCVAEYVKPAVAAMLAAHPYETPAYTLSDIKDLALFV